MKLLVSDRASVEAGPEVRSRYVVISIRDARRRKAKVRKQPGLVDVLYLRFDDAEPSRNLVLPGEVKLMTPVDAKAIWDFVAKHSGAVGTIVVQCEQGMSRSPAVAAALAKRFGLDETPFWEDHAPNRFVYGVMVGSWRGAAQSCGPEEPQIAQPS